MRHAPSPPVRLARVAGRPLLSPEPANAWERVAVFNPAVVVHQGLVHLFYRACDRPFSEAFTSVIGRAVSRDGVVFQRDPVPVLRGEGEQEGRGVEDPRITPLGGQFYLTYTAFGGRHGGDYRIALASSADLSSWERRGVLLDEPNKNGVLFPERIKGRYALLHRRHPAIWLAYSDDLRTWDSHHKVLDATPGTWTAARVGAGAVPVRTPEGWLLVFHGADNQNTYRLGAALLDIDDPSRVLATLPHPVLEPELPWEREGLVPNVVFTCGMLELDDEYWVYYGAADTCVGAAWVKKRTLLEALHRARRSTGHARVGAACL